MINEIKKVFQLIKYAPNRKTNIVFMILFMICGSACLFIDSMPGLIQLTGVCMIDSGIIFISQMVNGVYATGIGLTAPDRKKMSVLYAVVINTVLIFVVNIVVGGILIYVMRNDGIDDTIIKIMLIAIGFFNIVIPIYTGAAFKHFILSIVAFFLIFCVVFVMLSMIVISCLFVKNVFFLEFIDGIPLVIAYLISLLETIIGGFLYYVVAKAMYKLPYDKMALSAGFRKEN